jgi:diguanylate cyclase (GGDEF)-like protein/PAS domain S-box-containing protein
MTTVPPNSPEHRSAPRLTVRPATRSAIVAAWLRAAASSGISLLSRAELHTLLCGLIDDLADLLAASRSADACAETVGAHRVAAERVGTALVGAGFIDPVVVNVSLPTLGAGLLRIADEAGLADPVERTFAVLGAFGAGYTSALSEWLFARQEEIKVALHRATGEAQRALRRSESWFQEVFLRAGVGIAISDTTGKIAQANPALADILGVPRDELVGRGIQEFLHPEDVDDTRSDYHGLISLGGKPLRRRRRFVRPDGQPVWAYLTASVLSDSDETATLHLTMVENVSDLHLLQDLTTQQALHDGLTGLPNRQYLLSQLQSILGGPANGDRVTLYHLDLDGFAAINEGIGTYHGDMLLGVAARRIDALFFGQRALVTRLGGDEFAVLISDGATPSEVLETVGRINNQLAEPVHLAHGGVGLSACIGVAHGKVGRTAPFELLRAADSSLRRAQRVGNRQWVVYDERWDTAARRTSSLAATLGGALEFGELDVLWQPWTLLAESTPTDRVDGIAGISAQVRWDHGELGLVEHHECLELADLTGASLPLGEWLMREACRQVKTWQDRFDGPCPPLGVALTTSQIADPDLIGTVGRALEVARLRPSEMSVGVPAPALLSLDSEAAGNLGVLVAMGVRVVLTEVGVTPRDLAVLDEWPVLAVQVAVPLVRELGAAKPESMLARMAGALAGTLCDAGLAMLVPGVHTAAQAAWWRSVGASAACGPYFGPALTEERLVAKFGRR